MSLQGANVDYEEVSEAAEDSDATRSEEEELEEAQGEYEEEYEETYDDYGLTVWCRTSVGTPELTNAKGTKVALSAILSSFA